MQVSDLQQLAERIYRGDPQLKPQLEREALELIGQHENLPMVREVMQSGPYPILLVGSALLHLINKGD